MKNKKLNSRKKTAKSYTVKTKNIIFSNNFLKYQICTLFFQLKNVSKIVKYVYKGKNTRTMKTSVLPVYD